LAARARRCAQLYASRGPSDKCLAETVLASPAEQIRESEGRVPIALARHENQRSEERLSFLEADFNSDTRTNPWLRSPRRGR
jgi:hypothetical protein